MIETKIWIPRAFDAKKSTISVWIPHPCFYLSSRQMNDFKSRVHVRDPIRVGGEWLYSMVLVEAARRPFNRTQLESLSGPVEKIDTNGSSEQSRFAWTTYVALNRGSLLYPSIKTPSRFTRQRQINCARVAIVKKSFSKSPVLIVHAIYNDKRVSTGWIYIRRIKRGADDTRLTEMQIRSRRIKPTIVQAPVALDVRREGVNYECTKRVFKHDWC